MPAIKQGLAPIAIILLLVVCASCQNPAIIADSSGGIDASKEARLLLGPDQRLLVRVKVNELDGLFVLDTGTGTTALFKSFVDRLHIGFEHASRRIYAYDLDMMTIGSLPIRIRLPGLKTKRLRADIYDDEALKALESRFGWIPCDGILGQDFLLRNHARIDLARMVLQWPSKGAEESHSAAILAHLYLVPGQTNVTIYATVNGHPTSLLVDTGACGVQGSIADNRRLFQSVEKVRVPPFSSYSGGTTRTENEGVTIHRFTIGSSSWSDLPFGIQCSFQRSETVGPEERTIDGVLGLTFLAQNGLIIDLDKMALWQPALPRAKGISH